MDGPRSDASSPERGKPRFCRRKVFWIPLSVYAFFWFLTGTWGCYDVDRHFDEQYAYGYAGWPRQMTLSGGVYSESQRVPIDRVGWFNVRDLNDPKNADAVGRRDLFRYRSRGIPVAPFLIIDDIAEVRAVFNGMGATRVNFWFFGYTKWWVIEAYWCV